MCKVCKGTYNVRERIASHSFVEQMREFNGIREQYLKDRKNKKSKKSILAQIAYQILVMESQQQYAAFHERLTQLLEMPFDKVTFPATFDVIMNEFYDAKRAEIFEYYRAQG